MPLQKLESKQVKERSVRTANAVFRKYFVTVSYQGRAAGVLCRFPDSGNFLFYCRCQGKRGGRIVADFFSHLICLIHPVYTVHILMIPVEAQLALDP